ncbi:MAG: BON domain-containing protein [Betaproteobacteria bacterium]
MTISVPVRSVASAVAMALAVGATPFVAGCVPAVIAVGVGAGALVVADRRSTGAQLDDQTIEVKVSTAAGSKYGDKIHLNVISYNGNVLLTGEAPTITVADDIAKTAKATDRVRSVQNEIVIGATTDLGARSNDTVITSKVKARFVEANKFHANYVKVVTERSVVYLMGIVSRQEADAAAEIAATTSGVARVVKVFEYPN